MKLFPLICLFLLTGAVYGQSPALNNALISCFSQGWAGSYATNCASVSAIKLAISKYGPHGAFLHIDTLPGKYVISLRNSSKIELTSADLATMENLNKFHYTDNSDTVEAAKLMYAVMAKNKMSQHPEQYASLTAAATDKGGWFMHRYTIYQLAEDTYINLKLLGIATSKIKQINISEIQNYPNIIITSLKHSAYATLGTYDEYGAPMPVAIFSTKHRDINTDKNYIITD